MAILLVGCSSVVTNTNEAGPVAIQPGAPGDSSRIVYTDNTAAHFPPGHTAADVRFMQGMMAHHAQALQMTRLVPERTQRDDIRLLAHRIEASQEDEIILMQRWLAARRETVLEQGTDHGHHGHHNSGSHAVGMPGMLTQEQLSQLAAARGDDFDRLFLEFMIFHHQGALIMVEELFGSEGAGQETEAFEFASHIDSDQRMEVLRMRRMLSALLN